MNQEPHLQSDETHTARVRRAVRRRLVPWFEQHRRAMPWRTRRTPYRVWISELMLQQTRVDQATPYFNRFMKAFPSVKALAEAPLQDVLKQWEGLGYYARARRAHETARLLRREHGGRFPRTYEGLLALPGVGPYTAAAIGSLCMGLDTPVLDGNVKRVFARVFATEEDVASIRGHRRLLDRAHALLVPGKTGQVNEALMELGATVCLPRKPRCAECPLGKVCRARASGDPTRYPVKGKRKAVPHRQVGAGVIVNDHGQVLIAQRKEGSMLGGLWEFPGGGQEEGESMTACIRRELQEELRIRVKVGPHLVTVRHAFSHFTMDLHAYWVRIQSGRPRAIGCAAYAWVDLHALEAYPLPRADQKIKAALAHREFPLF
jgi:A/G-specific adenine glycosylase